MLIEIEPHDTLFFRDGKPFTMGEDVWANGIFPPSPSVIYGALRAIYFGNNINDISLANTESDPTKDLKIKGIFYELDGKFYIPAPLDIVNIKNTRDSFIFLQLRKNDNNNFSSIKTNYTLFSDKDVEIVTNSLIEVDHFNQEYIKSDRSNLKLKNLSSFMIEEPKIGIGRDKETLTSKEGKLYRVGMYRLSKFKLIIHFDGLDIPSEGIVRLGGESKTCSYKCRENDFAILEYDKVKINSDFKFCLYLSTPAILKNGWLPEWININTFEVKKDTFKVQFLTAIIGKSLSIGGFDMAENCPKPMRKAVPAGSVYYFKAETEQDLKSFIREFHGKSFSDETNDQFTEFNNQGFGISYIGGI